MGIWLLNSAGKITAVYSGSELLTDVLLSHKEKIVLILASVSIQVFRYIPDSMSGHAVNESLDIYHLQYNEYILVS